MLLRREVAQGVAILAPVGRLEDADAQTLLHAIADAAALAPRAVLLDLSATSEVSPAVLAAVRDATALAPGWPHASLVLCCSSDEVRAAIGPGIRVHACREDALAHVDDRRSAPRQRIELDDSVRSPARARAAAADMVAELHLEPIGDELALVVSELVTNAVLHAQPPVRLEIQADADRVIVAVADASPRRPVPRHAADEAEGGRGLTMIDLIASEVGVRPTPPGKTVWAALSRR